jgi:hypothetical protein
LRRQPTNPTAAFRYSLFSPVLYFFGADLSDCSVLFDNVQIVKPAGMMEKTRAGTRELSGVRQAITVREQWFAQQAFF